MHIFTNGNILIIDEIFQDTMFDPDSRYRTLLKLSSIVAIKNKSKTYTLIKNRHSSKLGVISPAEFKEIILQYI